MVNLELIKPLPAKEIIFDEWWVTKQPKKIPVFKRVLEFDPAPLYQKVADKINPTKRHQGLSMEDVFPKVNGICACGCGGEIKKHSATSWSKWATQPCNSFASDVLSIMNNYFGRPAFYITLYYGAKCFDCSAPNGYPIFLELDHIVGVKHGGGACWLSNYVWRCKDCHNSKTNKDFGHKGQIINNAQQTKLL